MRARDYVALGIAAVLLIAFFGGIVRLMLSGSPESDSIATTSTSTSEPTDAPQTTDTPEPTPAPPSKEELRERREPAQKYWSAVIGDLAMAGATIGFAGDSFDGGDAVAAQQLLTQAEKFSDMAYDAASNDEPSGDEWTDIQSALMNTASTYKKAIGEFKDGMGQDDSEKVAAALDDARSAGESVNDATHSARLWYEANGGKWSDIEDYQTAVQQTSASLKSLLSAMSSQ